MTNILREHPYLVAEEDGEIIGYATRETLWGERPTAGRQRQRST